MENDVLEQIGLTKSEINVYLALLELGSSSTGKIIDSSGASSSKIYEILDRLIQKGLVSFIIKSGVKFFEAAQPKRIMDYFKEKEDKLNEQKKELLRIIPELELKKELSKYKSEATIYKGMKGFETAFYGALNLLKQGDEMLVISGPSRPEHIDRFMVKFNKERARKKVKLKVIWNEGARGQLRTLPENNPLSEVKFVPQTTSASVEIFGNRVLINPKTLDPLIIAIDSQEVADSFRVQFEAMWNQKAQSYEGQEGVEYCFQSLIDNAKPSDNIVVFAAKPVTKQGADYNINWNKVIRQKVNNVRLLYYGDNSINMERAKEMAAVGCETRILPTEQTLPISTIISGNTVVNAIWSKNPTTFKMENKTVAESLRTNFDLLWNQDTTVHKGFHAVTKILYNMLDEVGDGGEYVALGASFGIIGQHEKYVKFFDEYHKKRIQMNIKAKLLFEQGTLNIIKSMGVYSGIDIKFLPYKSESPVEIFLYNNTSIILIQEEEPTIITIKNKEVYRSFKKNFETLWNQDITVYRGFKEFEEVTKKWIDDLKEGDEYYVLGAAFGITGKDIEYEKFFRKYHTYRIRNKIKVKLLFQQGTEEVVQRLHNLYSTLSQVKFLLYRAKSPVATFISKDKILMIIQEKTPIVIEVENKEVALAYMSHFESLWNQDTRVVRGLDAIQDIFEEMTESGHCDFIAARGYFVGSRPEYINKWEKKAIKKGFTMRNIVDPETKGHRITTFPFAQTKYTIPKEFSQLSVFWIYGNKVVISNWVEKEPIAVIIENKNLHDMYKQQFELLWKKDKF